jgi:hypothetical protein
MEAKACSRLENTVVVGCLIAPNAIAVVVFVVELCNRVSFVPFLD